MPNQTLSVIPLEPDLYRMKRREIVPVTAFVSFQRHLCLLNLDTGKILFKYPDRKYYLLLALIPLHVIILEK